VSEKRFSSNSISPASAFSRKFAMRSSVVFPEPEGPITATTSPFFHAEVDALQDFVSPKLFLMPISLSMPRTP
jgi:hypothetical protein